MNYNSVAEIYDAIDGVRARLRSRVEGLDDGRDVFRPAEGVWSVAEVVEHLSIIEGQMVRLASKLLDRAEADGGAAEEARPLAAPVTIERFVEESRTQKFDAPDGVRPTGSASVADSLARLAESRAGLHALRPRLERVDGFAVTFPHPAWGPLNLYQWLAFVGAHEHRHLRQIERLLAEQTKG